MEDIEKGPMTTTYATSAQSSPDPNLKRLSSLQQFQILVGDVDAPPSPTLRDEDLYHEIIAAERSARNAYYISGFFFFFCVILQIVFCLTITVGANLDSFNRTYISILAAVNTVVAATIGILKGLGLPDKKALERVKLQRIIDRIKLTTRRLKVGIDVDADKEVTELQQIFDAAEDMGMVNLKDVDFSSTLKKKSESN